MVRKFFLFFIFLIFIPFLFFSLLLQGFYSAKSQTEIAKTIGVSYEQLISLVDEEIREKTFLISTLAYDTELIDLVSRYRITGDKKEILRMQQDIDSRLQAYIAYKKEIEALAFYYRNQGMYLDVGDFVNEFNTAIIDEEKVRNFPSYRKSLEQKDTVNFRESFQAFRSDSEDTPHISLFLSPPYPGEFRPVEMIHLSVALPQLSGTQKSPYPSAHKHLLVMNSDQKEILRTFEGEVPWQDYSRIREITLKRGRIDILKKSHNTALLARFLLPKTGWTFLWFFDLSQMTSEYRIQLAAIRAGILLTMCLFLLFMVYQYRSLVHPIDFLIQRMSQIGDEDLRMKLTPRGSKEVIRLYDAFNEMLDRIDELTREKLKAEIEALQFQINPHFLSNTLSAIRLMAMIDKNENIKSMTEALMKITAASLDNGGKYTTLSQQIENARHYVFIMNIRYGNLIHMDCSLSEETENLFILKMLIQPVIENSIIHGLREKTGEKKINISASVTKKGQNEELLIIVEDNGSGFSRERFDSILSQKSGSTDNYHGIGLKNVMNRIKFNYGPPCGLMMESCKGQFTRITISLPVLRENPDV